MLLLPSQARRHWNILLYAVSVHAQFFDVFYPLVTMLTWLLLAQLKALLLFHFYHRLNRVIVAQDFVLASLKSSVHQNQSTFLSCPWIRKHIDEAVENALACCYNTVDILWNIN